ncbi:MAG: hypothetical protein RR942_04730 [Romboutsia sp.]
MENKRYKIGQQIKFEENFEIESFRGRKIQVKKGDKAVVTGRGLITYLTGEAKEMRQVVKEMTVEDYDHRNISKMILQRLINVYNLEEFMEYEEIQFKEMIDEMEDVLCEIL